MIKVAATSTDVRKEKLINIFLKQSPNISRTLQPFGLKLSTDFAQINARKIDAPILEYGDNETVQPQQGVWRTDNLSFINATEVDRWSVLVLDAKTTLSVVKEFCTMVGIELLNFSSVFINYIKCFRIF